MKLFEFCKNTFSRNIKVLKGIALILLLLFGAFSYTLPISIEFFKISLLKRIIIIGSIICGIVSCVLTITFAIKNGKKDKKHYYDILYVSPVVLLEIINILSFFNYELWGYKMTMAGFALLFIMFVEIFASIRTLFKKSFGNENTPVTLLALAIVSFVLAAVNEGTGNIEPANLCYKICFGLAYLVAIALYTQQYIYKTKKSEKIVSNIIGIIFWGAAITITFPYYVKWCGLSETAFETFVSVYAAVLGGGITLAGVAWTINDANKKRKEDIQRIEDDRKEEERKKNIPYLMLANGSVTPNIARITETNNLDFSKATDVSKIKDGTYYVIKIDPFNVKNVSQSIAILKGIFLDEVYHKFAHDVLIEKDGLCQVQVGINHWFAFPRKITSVRLLITDTLFNEYTIECEMYKKQDDKPQKYIAPNGIEYTVCSYNYIAETILLPEYKTEEEFDE